MTDIETPMTDTDREFTVARWFDAPREAVFGAWTDPAQLEWFLNPEQPRPAQSIEVDLRVGGAWRVPMVIDAETDYTTGGIYLEIVPNEKLVFAWGAVDGWPKIDPDDLEAGPIASLELVESDGGTNAVLTVRLPGYLSAPEVRRWLDLGIRDGWAQTFGRLRL